MMVTSITNVNFEIIHSFFYSPGDFRIVLLTGRLFGFRYNRAFVLRLLSVGSRFHVRQL